DKSDNIHIIYSIGGAEIFYTTSARLGSVSLYSEYFTLYQNYPNPFNSYTLIPYDMKVPGYVSLKVYDMMGKLVAVLVDEYKGRGRYFAIFDGSDLPSGVYVYEFRVGSFRRTGKMILAK
ncbi:MAG: T9SS type A sorting domain-containing protein, partial [Candidatus Hydrothermales bacterium]